jgi:MarR family transcriptional regulator for hemolysin
VPGPPPQEPIGRRIATVAKTLDRAFASDLAAAGGSVSTWLIVLSLKQERWRTQQELARAVGIEGPTLTHHLDALESAGLVARERDTRDRRAVRVVLTDEGEAAFQRMRRAALAFDRRLRAGLDDTDLDAARDVLARLEANAAPDGTGPTEPAPDRRGPGDAAR